MIFITYIWAENVDLWKHDEIIEYGRGWTFFPEKMMIHMIAAVTVIAIIQHIS